MMKVDNAYRIQLIMEHAIYIFQRPKPKTHTWHEHFINLVEFSHAAATSDCKDEEESPTDTFEWVLDSDCGRHLIIIPNLLLSNIVEAETLLYLPDGHHEREGPFSLGTANAT